MAAVVSVVDQAVGGPRSPKFQLHLATERLTCRELVSRRVREEIAILARDRKTRERTLSKNRSFLIHGLSPAETALNGSRRDRKAPAVDEATEIESALAAFDDNRFVILFNDKQIADLDEEIVVTPESEITFLRLLPLAGG